MMSNDDLEAAAGAAHYLASTVANIVGLRAEEDTQVADKLYDELIKNLPTARVAIGKVVAELRCTRAGAARFGDITAPTANEVAVRMVYALNRQRFGVEPNLVGRKAVEAWPDADAVIAETEIELDKARRARGSAEWSEAKSPAEWRQQFGISHTTLKRHVKEGKLVVREISSKSWSIRLDTLRKYLGDN